MKEIYFGRRLARRFHPLPVLRSRRQFVDRHPARAGALAGGKFTSFSSMDGLGSDFIGAILRSSGSLPVRFGLGLRPGLSRLQNRRLHQLTVQQGLSNNTVTAIAQDTPRDALAGNQRRRPQPPAAKMAAIQAFPWSSQGLPGTIYGMLEDAAGRLWLSSKTGIFRVSIAAAERVRLRSSPCDCGRRPMARRTA